MGATPVQSLVSDAINNVFVEESAAELVEQ